MSRTATHGMSLDIARDNLTGLSIHGNSARDKDEAVCLDGLAIDARQGLGGLVSHDGGLLSHGDGGIDY